MRGRIALGILAAFLLFFAFYITVEYPIEKENDAVKKHLTEWASRFQHIPDLQLKKVMHLGSSDTYIAFYTIGTNTAIAVLKEGLNGKLKIVQSSTGNSMASYESIETNEGYYGAVKGRNPDHQIRSLKVNVQNTSIQFELDIPKQPYFVLVKKLPDEIKEQTYGDLFFFNQENDPFTPE